MDLLMVTSLMKETETLSKQTNQIRNINLNRMNYPLIFLRREKRIRNLNKREGNEGECYFEGIEHGYNKLPNIKLLAPSNRNSSQAYFKLNLLGNNSYDSLNFYKFIPVQNYGNNLYNNKSSILLKGKYSGNIKTDLKHKIENHSKVNDEYVNPTETYIDLYNINLDIPSTGKLFLNGIDYDNNAIKFNSSDIQINNTEDGKNKSINLRYNLNLQLLCSTPNYYNTEINKTAIRNNLLYNVSGSEKKDKCSKKTTCHVPSTEIHTTQMPSPQQPSTQRQNTIITKATQTQLPQELCTSTCLNDVWETSHSDCRPTSKLAGFANLNLTFNIIPTVTMNQKDYDQNKTKKSTASYLSKYYFFRDYDRSTKDVFNISYPFTPSLPDMFTRISKSDIMNKIVYDNNLISEINNAYLPFANKSTKVGNNTMNLNNNSVPVDDASESYYKLNFNINIVNDESTKSFQINDSVTDNIESENDFYQHPTLNYMLGKIDKLGINNQLMSTEKYYKENDEKEMTTKMNSKTEISNVKNDHIDNADAYDLNVIDRKPFISAGSKSQLKYNSPKLNKFTNTNGKDVYDLKSWSNLNDEIDGKILITYNPFNFNKFPTTLTGQNINGTNVPLRTMDSTLKSWSNLSDEIDGENLITYNPLDFNKFPTTLTGQNINGTDVYDLRTMDSTLKSWSNVSDEIDGENLITYNPPNFNDFVTNNDDNDVDMMESTLKSLFTLRDDLNDQNPITFSPPNVNEFITGYGDFFNGAEINDLNKMERTLNSLFNISDEIESKSQMKHNQPNFNKVITSNGEINGSELNNVNVMESTLKNLFKASDEIESKSQMKHNQPNFNKFINTKGEIIRGDNICNLNADIGTLNGVLNENGRPYFMCNMPNNYEIKTTTVSCNINFQKNRYQNNDWLRNPFTTTTRPPSLAFILDEMFISGPFLSNNTKINSKYNNLGFGHYNVRRATSATPNQSVSSLRCLPNNLWPYTLNLTQLEVQKLPAIKSFMNPVYSRACNISSTEIDKVTIMKSFMDPVDETLEQFKLKNKYIKPILSESFPPAIVKAMRYIDKSFMNYPTQVHYSPHRLKINRSKNHGPWKLRNEYKRKLKNNKVKELNHFLFNVTDNDIQNNDIIS